MNSPNSSFIDVQCSQDLEPLEPRILFAATAASWSDSFVDSIGVMVHSNYWDTDYNPIQPSIDAIEDIGFRHVRGMIAPFYDRLDPGFQTIAYADARDANGYVDPSPSAVTDVLENIKDAYTRPEDVVAIEGPNEYNGSDDPNMVANLNGFMQELYTQMRADPWFDHIALLGPSMNYTKVNYGQFGSQAEYLDAVNLHNYGFAGEWQSNEFAVNREWTRNQPQTDHLPAWATESGYSYNSIGDDAQGRYWPRMFLSNWNRGVIKTVGYELVAIGDGSWGILAGATYKDLEIADTAICISKDVRFVRFLRL
ncbi:MAG: hypothetical protein AAF711_00070 [Planctomycetota bacterium]